jgi:Trypsin
MVSFKLNETILFLVLLFALAFHCSIASDGYYVRRVQESSEVDEDLLDLMPDDGQGILGGFPVNAAIPYLVYFQDAALALCAGVLVHRDIVLTAAQCVTGAKYPTFVRIGSSERFQGGILRNVSRGRIHPDWNGSVEEGRCLTLLKLFVVLGRSSENLTTFTTWFLIRFLLVLETTHQGFDVAVLKLSRAVNMTEITEIAIMNGLGNVPRDDQQMFTPGFDTNSPNQLQGLNSNYVDQCERRFPLYNPTFFLCANATAGKGTSTPAKGTCAGDRGGPILLDDTNIVVGLNSFSNNVVCGSQTVDIYTRVSTYRQWIVDQICTISSSPPESGCPASCLFALLLYRSVEVMRNFPGF